MYISVPKMDKQKNMAKEDAEKEAGEQVAKTIADRLAREAAEQEAENKAADELVREAVERDITVMNAQEVVTEDAIEEQNSPMKKVGMKVIEAPKADEETMPTYGDIISMLTNKLKLDAWDMMEIGVKRISRYVPNGASTIFNDFQVVEAPQEIEEEIEISSTPFVLIEPLNRTVVESHNIDSPPVITLSATVNILSLITDMIKWDMKATTTFESTIKGYYTESVRYVGPFKISKAFPKVAEQIKQILLRYNAQYEVEDIIYEHKLDNNGNSIGENKFKKLLSYIHPDKGSTYADKAQRQVDFQYIGVKRDEFLPKKNTLIDVFINEVRADEVMRMVPVDDTAALIEFADYSINKAKVSLKSIKVISDINKLSYEPTSMNLAKLTFDVISLIPAYGRVHDIYNDSPLLFFLDVSNIVVPALKDYTTIIHSLILSWEVLNYINDVYIIYAQQSSLYAPDAEFKSLTAYKDLYLSLRAYSPSSYIAEGFKSLANNTELKINEIKLNAEKAEVQTQLAEKGEFGQKLYNYFYAPDIEEKYDLLNKVLIGDLTKEQAEAMQTKHVKITLVDQVYEDCVTVKTVEDAANVKTDSNEVHYYCYNEEQQKLEHLLLTENSYIGTIESFYSPIIG